MRCVVPASYLGPASLVVAFLVAPLSVPFAEAADRGQADAASVVERYNAGIRLAEAAVESLRVCQDMDEPQTDGTTRHARAVLSYARGEGMERRVLSSNLAYPAGPSDYRVRLEGTAVVDGIDCHHLVVEAVTRDRDHLDGEVWVSRSSFALVRILGRVSAPPFPLAEIRLDKRFAPGPWGFSLLRSHAGEVQAGLVLGRKRGTRYITYRCYVVNGRSEG
jgi:hypothetical protein